MNRLLLEELQHQHDDSMKYQEQVNGITQQMMSQAPQGSPKDPKIVEQVMAQAAQQVLNANQAMGMAQSPEQQMVSLEQAKVELEKEKLKMSSAKNSADAALESQKLELEEMKLLKDLVKKITNSGNTRINQKELKKHMNVLDQQI